MQLLRSIIADLLAIAGVVCLTIGGWWLAPWVGMVVLGLGMLVLAWAVDPPRRGTVIALPPDTGPEPEAEFREAPGFEWGAP